MEPQLSATRVAALYDIHGNLPALEAALEALAPLGADLILVGGDVASGPMPRETLDLLMSLGGRARCLRGNADRELVARYDLGAEAPEPPEGEEIGRLTAWVARQLTRAHRDFLAAFPQRVTVEIAGLGPVLFCHGSPRSDEEILTRATPERRLREALTGVAQPAVVCGHTHMQFDRTVGPWRVVNAGSVGMSYEGRPGAYWALLGPDVELRRAPYDHERAAERIRATRCPGAEEFARENVLAPPGPDEATAFFERMAAG